MPDTKSLTVNRRAGQSVHAFFGDAEVAQLVVRFVGWQGQAAKIRFEWVDGSGVQVLREEILTRETSG